MSNPFFALIETLMSPSLPLLLLGLLIVFLAPVALHLYLSRTQTYTTLPSILLLGPSGAGKTSLLTLLERRAYGKDQNANGRVTETHTSQVSSAVELAVSEDGTSRWDADLDAEGATAKKFMLVDMPGHGKLRGFAMAPLVAASGHTAAAGTKAASGTPGASTTSSKSVRAVVFMVDSSILASEPDALSNTASYLYDVLLVLQKRVGAGKTSKTPPQIPVLVAVNKLDLFTAIPAAKVKSDLEAELGRIRATRSKGLLDSGVGTDELGSGSDEAEDWLGEYGSDKFLFSQMAEFEMDVDVAGGSVLGANGQSIDQWWSWIANRV